jgi:rubrerythrin
MDILNIIDEIAKVDGEIYERLNPRRKAMRNFFDLGKKVSMAALPIALTGMFQKAYGDTTVNTTVVSALNLALALEYLEFNLYDNALTTTPTLIPDAAKPIITTLRTHEQAHINLLIATITQLGGVPQAPMPYAAFNYTTISTNVTTNYSTFLRTAMSIEDFGVRAYKGQLPSLVSNPSVLAAAAQIHSVEARHSAQLRKMVYDLQIANLINLRPWLSNRATDAGVVDNTNYNDSTVGALSTIYYEDSTTLLNAENKVTQAGILLTGINGFTNITANAAAQSFDEYLQTATVKTIANALYIKAPYQLT